MPHESDGPKPSNEDMDRALFLMQDESYLRGLDHREDIERGDQFMDAIRQSRAEREAKLEAQRQNPDFQGILETNVSKTKRIPFELVTENWDEKEKAAQREAELRPTALESAHLEQFSGKTPVFHEGRIIEVVDPNRKEEPVKEVRKGTHSRHVHKTKTSKSSKLRNPPKPGRGGDKNAPQHITQIDGERIIR